MIVVEGQQQSLPALNHFHREAGVNAAAETVEVIE